MTDHNGKIRLCDDPVALHHIAHLIGSVIQDVRLGIVIDDPVRPEPVHRLFPQVRVPLLERVLSMQSCRAQELDVLDLGAPLQEFLDHHGDRNLAVALGVRPSLDSVRKTDHHFLVGTAQFPQRRKPKGLV